ncbi:MAG: T9SS type A sorting domain-containing protein [Bacteroidetes bacterium]|nr:T9SS type A sorting domain-containing protein [Bacteroidota bacterium]
MRNLFITFILLFSVIVNAQPLRWVKLNTYPNQTSRGEDLCFINSQTGWVVTSSGNMYKTINGGYTWTTKGIGAFLRCISFSDSLRGFIGIYDTAFGGFPLLRTSDGGSTWVGASGLPTPKAKGFCGIQCVDANTIYAVGRIESPARIIKSTNGGSSWFYLNIDTSLATRLVDIKFFTPDSGFVTGGKGPSNLSTPVILFTSDGGTTWISKFTGSNLTTNQAIWKISFSSRNYAVGSFNQQAANLQFVKSTDGGMTWNMFSQAVSPSVFTQGIAFINENTGWVGGGASTYLTTNGGVNWTNNTFGTGINRIRFYSDTLGYASGIGFYKYTADVNIKIDENNSAISDNFKLYQNYPNPFNPTTSINYEVKRTSFVRLIIYNSIGEEVRVLKESPESIGTYEITWDGRNNSGAEAPSGIYYLIFTAGDYKETRKMVLVR